MKMTSVTGFIFMICIWCSPAYTAECDSDNSVIELAKTPLPERGGPRTKTSGRVPHVQIGVKPDTALNEELFKLAFSLPGLEERPTVVSLPGATGMWLTDDVSVVKPKAIVSGREFAHIHTDGSLHAPLPFDRAVEVEKKGWGERHPWADRFDGWEGLVMLYSVSTEEELKTLVQLIAESYTYVTGQSIEVPNC